MKNRKRQGPKTEPWGTPEETLITSKMQLSTTTFWDLLLKKDLVHNRTFSLKP